MYSLGEDVQRAVRDGHGWLSYTEGVEKIEEEIVKADITLLPYNKEHKLTGGARLKALEYMACGALVISTFEGIAGIQGLKDGEQFLLAESVQDIPDLISYALAHPEEARAIRENARSFALANIGWRKTTQELTERLALLG